MQASEKYSIQKLGGCRCYFTRSGAHRVIPVTLLYTSSAYPVLQPLRLPPLLCHDAPIASVALMGRGC